MKNLIIAILFFSSTLAFAASKLKYETVVDLSEHQGQTFFSVMQQLIKPGLDRYATEGFIVAGGRTAVAALKKVDPKVAARAVKAAGSAEKLKEVADTLNARQQPVTFYDLPAALADEGIGAGRYDLSTYLALVSGGGVAIKINENNFAYNVNYGTGENESDERTGRSFGEAPGRLALDASDKHYLQILENYVRSQGDNVEYFYLSLLQILLNNDVSNFENITEDGQAVATDFLAVYTAEQNRHLMSDLKRHPWDEALLEVTLLSAFHSGQKKIALIHNGEYTDVTLKQASGCSEEERPEKKASLVDYWQFSTSTDPEHCNRSGLNVGRRDFRLLGELLTAYQAENNPELLARVQRHFKSTRYQNNVFAQLSEFLINYETPEKLSARRLELAQDLTALLMQMRADANETGNFILNSTK